MTAAKGLTLRQLGPTVYLPSGVYSIGTGAIAPVLALSATELGASFAVAAVVAGMVGVGQILGAVPAGVLVSRIGERRTMLLGSSLAVPALLACVFASHVLLLAVAVMLVGLTAAAWGVARHAYMAEAVRPELRARAMSTLGGVGRIGTFLGPFAGSVAVHLMGLKGAYLVALGAAVIASVLLLALPEVPHGRPVFAGAAPALRDVIRDNARTLRTLGLAVLLVGALRASRQTILPLWGASLGLEPATIALIYGISGGVDMLLFYPAGKLMDLYGRRSAAVPAMALLGLAFALLPLANGVVGLAAAGVLMGIGNGLSAGLVMTVGADVSPAAGRAQFLGVWRVCADLGAGGGPLLIGAVTAVASLTASAVVVGAAGLLAAGLMYRWLARK
ncbi:MFS family permease [Actinoplanes lutulentus]|uniref:Putative MFS family arabinose efflux permease n=1 Tax=Actinoplanes lutulentus TaxID=1287878 RepID=A0A327ZQN2_9ACTN|nr:MFS transporter [Actinoplanes lutulentus]MBB2940959.1 MFS family permease [Actinoplanes lutulentus]RAK43268.1 putative MFS family arabinose efflux permease [Actinoplanes lutulentus]